MLVTGAGGFVGSWLTRALVDRHADVTVILRDEAAQSNLHMWGSRPSINVVRGSITDYRLVERALNEYEVDTCFHLAAQAIVGPANRSPLSTFESNIRGTWTVLEACRACDSVERVVLASSDKAYGAQTVLPYTEDTPLLGSAPYEVSKTCADLLARSYRLSFGMSVAVARCANIYGGGDFNFTRLVPGAIRSVLSGERPIIRSDGTPVRDYIFIDDAVAAYLALGAYEEHPAPPTTRSISDRASLSPCSNWCGGSSRRAACMAWNPMSGAPGPATTRSTASTWIAPGRRRCSAGAARPAGRGAAAHRVLVPAVAS